jgi:hypothetical protein
MDLELVVDPRGGWWVLAEGEVMPPSHYSSREEAERAARGFLSGRGVTGWIRTTGLRPDPGSSP